MEIKQNNLCAICEKPETAINYNTGEVKNLCVDHNHETNNVRELLCHRCNAGIGYFKEDIEILKKSIEYLKRHSEIKEETDEYKYSSN